MRDSGKRNVQCRMRDILHVVKVSMLCNKEVPIRYLMTSIRGSGR